MNLLILIMGSRANQYPLIANEGVFKTYGSLNFPNIDLYVYYGEYEKQEIINRDIHLLRDDVDCTGKTIEAFEFSLEKFQFDYLLRTTVSTFVRTDLLYNKLLTRPRENYFSGYIVGNNPETQFISGNNMIFSRDLVQKIVDDKNILFTQNKITDDCVLSHHLIWDNKIKPFEHFNRMSAEGSLENLKFLPKSVLEDYLFFRCKSSAGSRLQDIPKLFYLYETFYK